MRAAFCPQPGDVRVREAPAPRPQREGELLLHVRRCGICGSDLHWYRGESTPPPVCPGHEIAAVVQELGPGEHAVAVGDRVVVEGVRSCGACPACVAGQTQLCPSLRVLGLHTPGGFADLLVTDSRHVFRVPDEIDDETAQLAEPLAVGVHAFRVAPLPAGGRVLVLGAGSIGLLAIPAARAAGAAEIVVTARRDHQREAAAALGADACIDPAALRRWLRERRDPGFDVVLDTVADPEGSLDDGIVASRPGGSVVVVGLFFRRPSFDALRLMMREIRLVGSMCYGRAGGRADFEAGLAILGARGDELRRIVTHRVRLDELAEGFRIAADKRTGSIKVSVAISE